MDLRPPLANNLFDRRQIFREAMLRFPACQAVIPDLRDLSEKTVEQVLTSLQNDAKDDPTARQQLAAIQYYLHHALWRCELAWEDRHGRVTNYKTLLNKIHRWRRVTKEPVVIVTFNYDMMIEKAMAEYFAPQFPFNDEFHDYVEHQDYKLIKLHGSVNWAHLVLAPVLAPRPAVHNDVINRAFDLQLSDHFVVVRSDIMGYEERYGTIMYPAIAIPVVDKKDFECPKEQVEALIQALPHVTRMLTIGWRGTERNFVELLNKHTHPLPYIMTVAGNEQEAQKIGDGFVASGKACRGIIPATGGFTEAIRNSEIEEFLRIR